MMVCPCRKIVGFECKMFSLLHIIFDKFLLKLIYTHVSKSNSHPKSNISLVCQIFSSSTHCTSVFEDRLPLDISPSNWLYIRSQYDFYRCPWLLQPARRSHHGFLLALRPRRTVSEAIAMAAVWRNGNRKTADLSCIVSRTRNGKLPDKNVSEELHEAHTKIMSCN